MLIISQEKSQPIGQAFITTIAQYKGQTCPHAGYALRSRIRRLFRLLRWDIGLRSVGSHLELMKDIGSLRLHMVSRGPSRQLLVRSRAQHFDYLMQHEQTNHKPIYLSRIVNTHSISQRFNDICLCS